MPIDLSALLLSAMLVASSTLAQDKEKEQLSTFPSPCLLVPGSRAAAAAFEAPKLDLAPGDATILEKEQAVLSAYESASRIAIPELYNLEQYREQIKVWISVSKSNEQHNLYSFLRAGTKEEISQRVSNVNACITMVYPIILEGLLREPRFNIFAEEVFRTAAENTNFINSFFNRADKMLGLSASNSISDLVAGESITSYIIKNISLRRERIESQLAKAEVWSREEIAGPIINKVAHSIINSLVNERLKIVTPTALSRQRSKVKELLERSKISPIKPST